MKSIGLSCLTKKTEQCRDRYETVARTARIGNGFLEKSLIPQAQDASVLIGEI
jgi:hypothetical protein